MFIWELKITNFKSFNGPQDTIRFNLPNGNLGSGLNIFVGENNTGKSTVFESIDFTRNGSKKNPTDIKNKNSPLDAMVEITFEGEIEKTIDGFSQENKVNVFKRYIFQDNEGRNLFKIGRSTEDISKLKLWDNAESTYKNEAGIDAPIRKLFETNFVWADTNPNDEVAFGATTISGNLLKEIAQSFTETDDYLAFRNKFNEIFNNDDSGLRKQLLKIEERVQDIFTEQFGTAKISFHFDELKVESFFKSTTITVDDGIPTPMHEKGNGMQRAVALALLQVYAEELTKHPEDENLKKPFFLFIDEPEICLHPKGQEKLLNALLEISKTKQVFITTHSPYFLASPYLRNIGLHIFSSAGNSSSIASGSSDNYFPWSPTWGEINYKAYKLPSVEFHNELYGFIQERKRLTTISEFDNWISAQGISLNRQWIKEKNGVAQSPVATSLQSFIRNKIHHPENITMQGVNYTADELAQSIKEMIALL